MTITDDLIAFTNATPDLAARAVMQLSVMDWAACGMAGALDEAFHSFIAANASAGPCALLGGGTASAASAALINGTLSHALDFDDTHFGHIGHPSVAVVPAALAIAEVTNATLPEVMDAALIGAEASVHIGLWLGRDHYQIGYHQTATAGAFGATIAAARLLKLTLDQIRTALGLASTMGSGLKSQFGTMGKPLNAGLAARCGVEAALWAQSGMTSSDDGLAGPLGFGVTHHGQNNSVKIGQGAWQMETVSHKFHACCHGLHAMLEALSESTVDPDAVTKIQIRTHPRWLSVCNIEKPRTGLECKFSYAHTAAMALSGLNTGDITQFTKAKADNTTLSEIAKMVEVTGDDALSEMQAHVTLHTHEGDHVLQHDLAASMPLEVRAAKLGKKAEGLLGSDKATRLQSICENDSLKAFTDLFKTERAPEGAR